MLIHLKNYAIHFFIIKNRPSGRRLFARLYRQLSSAGGTSLWKYQAIYLLKDEKVEQWSYIASITVAG